VLATFELVTDWPDSGLLALGAGFIRSMLSLDYLVLDVDFRHGQHECVDVITIVASAGRACCISRPRDTINPFILADTAVGDEARYPLP
jgi:hypothetical protein